MLFSRTIKSAAALVLLTIGFAAPVHAQFNKQIISGTWYEDRASSTNTSTQLTLTFAQTPANQFLNVQCFLLRSSGFYPSNRCYAARGRDNFRSERPWQVL
jgi:hypothetical protein